MNEADALGPQNQGPPRELHRCGDIGLAELRMSDLHGPVPPVAASGLERILKPGDARTIDGLAHLQNGVVIRGDEVEIRGESSPTAKSALPERSSALEHQGAVIEVTELGL